MPLQLSESNGPAPADGPIQGPEKPYKIFANESSSLPFGQNIPMDQIAGPTYVTAQTLIQQVAYTLSDRMWTYSPESFDLDVAVKQWFKEQTPNVYGYATNVEAMEIRLGAASVALGYMFSPDFDFKKRYRPQSILASSSSLEYLRSSLDQLSLLYSVASPFVAHIAAVEYTGGSSMGLVADYVSALMIADDLGLGLVSSFSAQESQHMSLFATLLASSIPTLHVYDGIHLARETTRVVDVLDKSGLYNAYQAISNENALSKYKQKSIDIKVEKLLEAFNSELGTEYRLFEYQGHANPDSLLVVFGTAESSLASQVALSLERDGAKVGVLSVRVYRPFVEEAFIKAVPKSVKTIGVLGQVENHHAVSDASVRSYLYNDVVAAFTFTGDLPTPAIVDIKYPKDQVWTPVSIAAAYQLLVQKPILVPIDQSADKRADQSLQLLDPSIVQQYIFWDLEDSHSTHASIAIGQALSKDSSSNVTIRTGHDNLIQGGVVRTDVRKSKKSIDASYSIDAADVVYVGEVALVKEIDVLSSLKEGGKIIVRLPGVKDDDLEKKLPVDFRNALGQRDVQLVILDPLAIERVSDDLTLELYLIQLAFLRVAVPALEGVGIQKLAMINGNLDVLNVLAKDLDAALRKIEVPESWADVDQEAKPQLLPKDIHITSFTPFDKAEVELPSLLKTWQIAAKGLAFKEAFNTKSSLRPDLSVKSYTIHVKENRRLTPSTYDRNIFHIEFDLGSSGLKYEIGEALGIHAENDATEVQDFINFYNLNPSEIVEVPSRDDPSILENRTVYQALTQNIDLFGRPPKRFYEALAFFATDPTEKKELVSLGGLEGVNEFRRRAEVDTITYADVLLEFPSAHPAIHDIVRIVSPMKRREYSIASCQKVTPTSVALMIVVVNWADPKGRQRWGQATRYLKDLRPDSPVTVSVKPSVMKLPPKSTQPLVMAGLGTGLAPFRAFVQHRAWEKEQGAEIGPVLLYMGSRHQREEYCYGEEWEAYLDAGIITHLGRAFSRDQPQKIYIQDRMRESLGSIVDALRQEAAFYLCGPTWPVPDFTQVVEEAVVREPVGVKPKKVDSRKEIERLKDVGRFVLEVY